MKKLISIKKNIPIIIMVIFIIVKLNLGASRVLFISRNIVKWCFYIGNTLYLLK